MHVRRADGMWLTAIMSVADAHGCGLIVSWVRGQVRPAIGQELTVGAHTLFVMRACLCLI